MKLFIGLLFLGCGLGARAAEQSASSQSALLHLLFSDPVKKLQDSKDLKGLELHSVSVARTGQRGPGEVFDFVLVFSDLDAPSRSCELKARFEIEWGPSIVGRAYNRFTEPSLSKVDCQD